jgi:hypothetical protein
MEQASVTQFCGQVKARRGRIVSYNNKAYENTCAEGYPANQQPCREYYIIIQTLNLDKYEPYTSQWNGSNGSCDGQHKQ